MNKPLSSSDIKVVDIVASIKPLKLMDDNWLKGTRTLPNWVKGDVYPAKILEISGNDVFKVSIDGRQLMLSLRHHLAVGETLMLKYLGDESGPQFKVIPYVAENHAQVNLSATARDITEKVNLANKHGATSIYQAMIPATNQPQDVKKFAADLQQTIEASGLFYESHLADLVQGIRTAASLMQEPQNQGGPMLHHLIAQQLCVLETNRIFWQGEIWPGQLADWQIEQDRNTHANAEAKTIVSSHLNLQLPNLGNVTARIKLLDNRISISIVADKPTTASKLKINATPLMQSLENNVGRLEAISIIPAYVNE